MQLSFIIPFFNGGTYIAECLDSLYTQDIPETEYEVIVVDDCSTDNHSLDIVRTYMQKHANMHLLKNDKNLKRKASIYGSSIKTIKSSLIVLKNYFR